MSDRWGGMLVICRLRPSNGRYAKEQFYGVIECSIAEYQLSHWPGLSVGQLVLSPVYANQEA
jgi:hypothetical protein